MYKIILVIIIFYLLLPHINLTVDTKVPKHKIYDKHFARITAYCDIGTMASGKQTYKGAVATSDRTIPFGTKIKLPEGSYKVEDRTNKRFSKFNEPTIDFWMSDCQEAKEFGVKRLEYYILTPPPLNN
jgi:3D (Asp-Asp-Asp) domain-containing protein